MRTLKRRAFLKACGWAIPFLAGFGRVAWGSRAELPALSDPLHPSAEVFLALSRIVLNRPGYSAAEAQPFYDVFMQEPWGPQHIAGMYQKIQAAHAQTKDTPQRLRDLMKVFSEGERWFVNHMLTTYYLGIYYHEKLPIRRITRDGALMYGAVHGVLPLMYRENTGFGNWSKLPPQEKRKV